MQIPQDFDRRALWRARLWDIGLLLSLLATLIVVYALDSRSPTMVAQMPPVIVPPVEPEPEIPPVPEVDYVLPPAPGPPPLPEITTPPPVTPPPPPVEPARFPTIRRQPVDPVRRIGGRLTRDARFGVFTTSGNPDDASDDDKLLTYSSDGRTNNSRVWVDGDTPLFGSGDGDWIEYNAQDDGEFNGAWKFNDVQVEQDIKLTAGEVSGRIDTILVTYKLTNTGKRRCMAGLRVMLDTLIGDNDGVPYVVPGQHGLVTSPRSFTGRRVPDAIRALERSNLTNPGVLVNIGLRTGVGERPQEVILTAWPGDEADWDYDRDAAFGTDTAVGLYYTPRRLNPRQQRTMQFTYGLGTISSTASGNARLSLAATPPFKAGNSFWLTALVQNPRQDQRVRLIVPRGLRLENAGEAIKPVPESGDFTQVSWLVKIDPDHQGPTQLKARLEPENVTETQSITIEPSSARLILSAPDEIQAGSQFWVALLVEHPNSGQSVELTLPRELMLAKGHAAKKPVPSGQDAAQVNWLVTAAATSVGKFALTARLTPDIVEQTKSIAIRPAQVRLTLFTQEHLETHTPFWITAVVHHAQPGQSVELLLPDGVALAAKHAPKQLAPIGGDAPSVSWLVTATDASAGKVDVKAQVEPGGVVETKSLQLEIRKPRMQLAAQGPFVSGKSFWLPVVVYGAHPGQTVTVTLPPGLLFANGHSPEKAVRANDDRAQLNWLLHAGAPTNNPLEISAVINPGDISAKQVIVIEEGSLVR